jgi:CRISPR-associated endonuclease/helicase Cas3
LERPTKPPRRTEEPEYDSDLLSLFGWQSIAEHTDDVAAQLAGVERRVHLDAVPWRALGVAVRWHDWGKAHFVFQGAIKETTESDGNRPPDRARKRDIAKAAPRGFWGAYERRHFRHELASAIGVLTLLRKGSVPLEWSELCSEQQDLALYLIAAHHGKVRLSIRSMPGETADPDQPSRLFARGVYDGDLLGVQDNNEVGRTNLGANVWAPVVRLDLSPMQLGLNKDGSQSWAERMLKLRDHPDFGPMRLAYLEALVRAADMRASEEADTKAQVTHA